MDTSGIRLFVKAADMLNISAAGRQLGLAPAVASARLSKLEKTGRCGPASPFHKEGCFVP